MAKRCGRHHDFIGFFEELIIGLEGMVANASVMLREEGIEKGCEICHR